MGKELPVPLQKLAECASSSRHTQPSAKVFWFGVQMTAGCQPASALSPSPHRRGGHGGLRVTHSLLLGDWWRPWCWSGSQSAWFVTWFVTITSSEISSFIQNKIKFYSKFQWVDIGKNVDRMVKLEAYWMSSRLGFIFNFPTFGQDLTVHSHIYFLCLNN